MVIRFDQLCAGIFFFCVTLVCGETLNVPAEYATIQEALDSSVDWDTVLVAPGAYHEFLRGPDHSFVLQGWHEPDTTQMLLTVIDPIPAALDTPSAVTVSGDTALFKNIVFHNREGLRQYETPTRSGAIDNAAHLLVVEDCRFDSVSSPVWRGSQIEIHNSNFVGCVGYCVNPSVGGRVFATNTSFESEGYSLVNCYGGSRFDSCEFANNPQAGYLLLLRGSDVVVTNCKFGPFEGSFPAVDIRPDGPILIESCLFEGINRTDAILQSGYNCALLDDYRLMIRGNVFRNYHTFGPSSGTIAIDLECPNNPHGRFAVIEDNVFADGDGTFAQSTGIYVLNASAVVRDNSFEDLGPTNHPDVLASGSNLDTIFATNNSFLPPGLAASTAGSYFDARNNWWGDSTGPFNAGANPNGQGSEVGNGVLFDPWLTAAPDTTDTNDVFVDEIILASPESFSLSAHPNPFNATTTLTIEVARPGHYTVTLFDITGRRVRELFRSPITATETIRLDASVLSTGVYFARLEDSKSNLAVTKLLLLK